MGIIVDIKACTNQANNPEKGRKKEIGPASKKL